MSPMEKLYDYFVKASCNVVSSRWGAAGSGSGARRRGERARRARSSDSVALDYELLLQNKPRARNMQRLTGK